MYLEENKYLCVLIPKRLGQEQSNEWVAAYRRNFKVFYTNMYAIVEMQGQQFTVEVNQKLCVLHLAGAEEGKSVTFDNVLLVNNEGTITVGTPAVEGAKVVCEIVQPLVKGKKIKVFHKKRRKGFDKLTGARQHFTEVIVKEIVA